MRYGYDLFVKKVDRDRKNIAHHTLVKAVAAVWSTYLMEEAHATRFYEEIFMKEKQHMVEDNKRVMQDYVEWDIIPHLSDLAKQKLREIFKIRHGVKCVPIQVEQSRFVSKMFRLLDTPKCPKHAYSVLSADPTLNINAILERHKKMLLQATVAPNDAIASIFSKFIPIRFAEHMEDCYIKYTYDTNKDCIIMNGAHYSSKPFNGTCGELVCDIIPNVCEENNRVFDRTALFTEIFGHKVAAPIAAAAPASRAAPTKMGPPPPKKREREETIDGYVRVDGNDFIVFKKQ
jgi:hypothetical protein